jgi:hypothetical protein
MNQAGVSSIVGCLLFVCCGGTGPDQGPGDGATPTTDLASGVGDLGSPDLAPSTAVSWTTPCVILTADWFAISLGNTAADWMNETGPFAVSSGARTATACDLHVDWSKGGVAQHFYMHFTSDGANWWWDSTSFARGAMPPDWTYKPNDWKTPLGSAYSNGGGYTLGNTPGGVSWMNLRVQAFP